MLPLFPSTKEGRKKGRKEGRKDGRKKGKKEEKGKKERKEGRKERSNRKKLTQEVISLLFFSVWVHCSKTRPCIMH